MEEIEMKEVIVTAPHAYEIREVPIPVLTSEYEVLVKMKAAGVCGSDHHIYHGKNPNTIYPRIPGHENAGIVEKVGSRVSKVKVGDHVVADLLITCGICYQCRIGRKNVCETVKVRGSSADGGFREYLSVPEDDLYIVPNHIPFKDAALVEPYAIGAHCTGRGKVVKDDIVFILGTGTIGSIILQTCKNIGCTVICCDRVEETLERAKKYGADFIINNAKENVIERVREITAGKGATVAFDSACFPGSLTSLFEKGLIRNAGRIVSLGFSTENESISQAMLDIRELDLIGSRMSCYQFQPVIDKMANNGFNLDGIATTFINFNEIDRMFDYMDHPDPKVKKMVLLFD
ncbi:MAG: chlorophyll synthesis pathway protein BchC [Treponema sp. GWB1_62_6]|nr:MAG: chlorophyll synthesis pathway protein BchC [Treponema sp. GWA1_62_8]OHE63246.1 MAG: chlorophyll synthesis pathway protein BchC [Treponema sp. GWB1_62_6]OHE69945.1 MAG: chlorophyll synthesis pathway protein BchC [Treponema sp. GWC1_61_84]OHE70571.1 MAG: chlorophyll synthesis pathway protein BchC [Treponema sp. RIFOXYC1_FULL_61_9]HCM28064.1 chlorophyll synthesis pathway protein BchC [Treponema sp.]